MGNNLWVNKYIQINRDTEISVQQFLTFEDFTIPLPINIYGAMGTGRKEHWNTAMWESDCRVEWGKKNPVESWGGKNAQDREFRTGDMSPGIEWHDFQSWKVITLIAQ